MKTAALLFFISVLLSFVMLNPSVKKFTMDLLHLSGRDVLSTLEFEKDDKKYKLLKVSGPQGLSVELYRVEEGQILKLDTHYLVDKLDASYRFKDSKHNLLLKDLNKDGEPEIILPSLDKNMKARLNVFAFDPINEKLIKLSQH